jgi:hypothetical protein
MGILLGQKAITMESASPGERLPGGALSMSSFPVADWFIVAWLSSNTSRDSSGIFG